MRRADDERIDAVGTGAVLWGEVRVQSAGQKGGSQSNQEGFGAHSNSQETDKVEDTRLGIFLCSW